MERNKILALRVEELSRKLSELQLGTTGLKAISSDSSLQSIYCANSSKLTFAEV